MTLADAVADWRWWALLHRSYSTPETYTSREFARVKVEELIA